MRQDDLSTVPDRVSKQYKSRSNNGANNVTNDIILRVQPHHPDSRLYMLGLGCHLTHRNKSSYCIQSQGASPWEPQSNYWQKIYSKGWFLFLPGHINHGSNAGCVSMCQENLILTWNIFDCLLRSLTASKLAKSQSIQGLGLILT